MFLKNITINNYKSIQKATVGFENGLNIIIGGNGSGKSNLLEFIYEHVFYYSSKVIKKHFFETIDLQYTVCDKLDNTFNEFIMDVKSSKIITNDEEDYSNEVYVTKLVEGKISYEDKPFESISTDFPLDIGKKRTFHRLFISHEIPNNVYWLNKPDRDIIDDRLIPISEYNHEDFEIIYDLNNRIQKGFRNKKDLKFENNVLEAIKGRYLEIFEDFNAKFQLNHTLAKLLPIQETRINTNINLYRSENKIIVENLLLDFKVNDKWMPWSHLSQGTKKLFYVITQCLSLEDGLMLIEEPGSGIHPHKLYHLMSFLKEQSYFKQIIISTHSPMVLDILKPNELDRIIITKMGSEGTQFYKLNDEQKETAQKYMNGVADLSYYWLHSDLEFK